MRAVFRHELSGYFTTPVGYVFLTMYALLSGLVFVFINIGQEMSASMNLLFSGMQLPLMLIAPLLTMRLLSVGVLLSSLCTNQITAAILTLGVNVLMYLSEHYIVPQAGTSAYLHPVSVILGFLPSSSRLGDFANGIVSLSDIVYFVAFIALMLFLTDRAMEKRRHAKG